ncbi:MAG: hypothetical protein L0Y71_03150 [Gemmataceae bacterium]|nr:hypothetical protein [Gemmataceae bacterium]
MEVDQDHLPAGSKRLVDGLESSLRKLEVVVGVADEHQIDGVLRQLGRELIALDRLDVLDLAVGARLLDVTKKGLRDIDGEHLALVPDLGGKLPREQSGAGADVGDRHAGLELAGGDDLLGVGGDLPAFSFELLEKVLDVRVLEGLVDPGANALFLGADRTQRQQAERHTDDRHREPVFHWMSFR